MKAVVYHGRRDVRLSERPVPPARPGELLLRVATAGICGTDVLEYRHGPILHPGDRPHPVTGHSGPIVPGHEFSGWVAAAGPGVTGFAEGDLVSCGAGVSCGECAACRRGATNLCAAYWTVGLHRDGALADYVAAPATACLNLAGRAISADVAALAQPMSIAVHAVRRGEPAPGSGVTVLGTGGIGMFVTYALARLGAVVTAVDLDPARLALAGRLGAARIVPVSAGEPFADQVRDLIAASYLVLECTGAAEPLLAALELTPPGARIVAVGLQAQRLPTDFHALSMAEKEVRGTVAHAFGRDFTAAVDLLAADPTSWAAVAPAVRPLSDLPGSGLDRQDDPGQTKYLYDPALTAPRPLRAAP